MGGAPSRPPPPPPPPPKQYTGKFQASFYYGFDTRDGGGTLGLGWYSWLPGVGIRNDAITSIVVGPYTKVTVFTDKDFRSWNRTFTTGYYGNMNVYGLNDNISSVIIQADEPSDNRCRRGRYDQDQTDWRVSDETKYLGRSVRVLTEERTARDLDPYWGTATCTPPTTNGKALRDLQLYYDNTRFTGSDSFVKYHPNGAKQYCKAKVLDYGWQQKNWSHTNWQVYNPNHCDYYDRTGVPAIRAAMVKYELPHLFNGVSYLYLSQSAYTSAQMGALAGSATRVSAPAYFFVRGCEGDNLSGASVDYSGAVDLGTYNSRIRSVAVTPVRPLLVSRNDNYLGGHKMAVLMEDVYSAEALDDGVFSSKEATVTAGIVGLWVPPGFRVTITDVGNRVRDYYGHNANGMTWISLKPVRIQVRLVLPIAYTQANYEGFISLLSPGANNQTASRPVRSLRIPKGYAARCEKQGRPTDLRTGDVPNLASNYDVIRIEVKYKEKTHNMIDNFPVRTEVLTSEANFAGKCKQKCDVDYNCTAYYALRMAKECPNPAAANGEDPAVNGCRQLCGYYDDQGDNVPNAQYASVEPYLFDGKLSVKEAHDA